MSQEEIGEALNDVMLERFWAIIQHLKPGGAKGGAKGSLAPFVSSRPGAKIPGLAITNTKDYARTLDDEIIAEARAKRGGGGPGSSDAPLSAAAAGGTALPPPPPRGRGDEGGSSRGGEPEGRRERGDDRNGGRDGSHRDRDSDRHRERSRERGGDRDRGGGDRRERSHRDSDRDGERGSSRRSEREDGSHDRRDSARGGKRDRSRSRSPPSSSRLPPPPPGPPSRGGGGGSSGWGDERSSRDRPTSSRGQAEPAMLDAPALGGVYRGKVSGLMEFGCFVELQVRGVASNGRNPKVQRVRVRFPVAGWWCVQAHMFCQSNKPIYHIIHS